MASCAILELSARMLYCVSSDEVARTISLCLRIGDLPLLVIAIVRALCSLAIFKASTISLDEPECEMPIATSPSS